MRRRSVLPGPEALPRPAYIAADLGRVTLAAALAGSGFDPALRTLFTCEGLVYYLPEVWYRWYCRYCWQCCTVMQRRCWHDCCWHGCCWPC
jgi:hypothetical protein